MNYNGFQTTANRRRFSRVSGLFPKAVLGIIIVGMLSVLGFGGFAVYSSTVPTDTYSNCVVTDKDRVSKQDGGSEMRIYTENCGVLSVQDNILVGQINSADIYGSIKVGETYTFEAKGYRIPLISMFPNITSVTQSK